MCKIIVPYHQTCRWLCCYLLLLAPALYAQNSFGSQLLEQMSKVIPEVPFVSLSPGTYRQYSYKGLPLTIRVNQRNEVEHIGATLFHEGIIQRSPLIYDFLERYYLSICLPLERIKSIGQQIQEDDIVIETGNLNMFPNLRKINKVVTENLSGKRCRVLWQQEDTVVCSLSFPMKYQLIAGADLVELEDRLINRVLTHRETTTILSNEDFKKEGYWEDAFFIKEGESYILEQLNSNTFYLPDKNGQLHAVWDKAYPVESAFNVMLCPEVESKFILECQLMKFGNKQEDFCCPLRQWLSFCLSEGCQPYFGITTLTDRSLSGICIMRNEKYGYNHLLRIRLLLDDFGKSEGTVYAKWHAFIPTGSIKDLYEDLKNSQKHKEE